MKQFVSIFILGILMFSCGSKRKIAQREAQRQRTEQVATKKSTETTPSGQKMEDPIVIVSKAYASPTEAYIDGFKTIAQEEMKLYGIPASITLAQGILESGSGNGRLSKEANNHFGIKCHDWTGAKIYHDDDKSQECFRKYNNAKYSFRDHSLFLTQRKRYSKLFQLKKEDYKGWAKGLRAAGYATDKKYPQKLISLIERYELHKFDEDVLGDDYVTQDLEDENISYAVVKGDTLYSISRKYNISVKELQDMNGLEDTSLNVGQILQIKPSSKNY